jgi:hypothetical protein
MVPYPLVGQDEVEPDYSPKKKPGRVAGLFEELYDSCRLLSQEL